MWDRLRLCLGSLLTGGCDADAGGLATGGIGGSAFGAPPSASSGEAGGGLVAVAFPSAVAVPPVTSGERGRRRDGGLLQCVEDGWDSVNCTAVRRQMCAWVLG